MKLISVEQAKKNTESAAEREIRRVEREMSIYERLATFWGRIRLFFCKLKISVWSKHSSSPYVIFAFDTDFYCFEDFERYFFKAGYTVDDMLVERPYTTNKKLIRVSWGYCSDTANYLDYTYIDGHKSWRKYTPDDEEC